MDLNFENLINVTMMPFKIKNALTFHFLNKDKKGWWEYKFTKSL